MFWHRRVVLSRVVECVLICEVASCVFDPINIYGAVLLHRCIDQRVVIPTLPVCSQQVEDSHPLPRPCSFPSAGRDTCWRANEPVRSAAIE